MCKVSIIMPVYNKEKYIKKAIQSVLAQTMQDWELLIIDDGSTDNSFEICNSFKDERIKAVHVENGGVSSARNIGLDMANGEYVTFIDSDDYISKDYLQVLYNPREEMVIGGLTKVNLDGVMIGEIVPKLKGRKKIQEVAESFYEEQISCGTYGFVAGKMIKRDIVEQKHIRFDEKIHLAEDYDFFLRIYECVSNILFLNNTGYYYVQETENSGIVLDDSKIDFWVQIEIQSKTKRFLEEKQCFGKEEERMYLKRVTGYVYTILLLNQKMNYNNYVLMFGRLKEYVPSVLSKDMQGVGRWYVFCYDKNWRVLLFILLKVRKLWQK